VSTTVHVLTWDWREQADLVWLGQLVRDMSGGRVHLHPVEDTGTDQFVLLVSPVPLDDAAVMDAYRRWWSQPESNEEDSIDVEYPKEER